MALCSTSQIRLFVRLWISVNDHTHAWGAKDMESKVSGDGNHQKLVSGMDIEVKHWQAGDNSAVIGGRIIHLHFPHSAQTIVRLTHNIISEATQRRDPRGYGIGTSR